MRVCICTFCTCVSLASRPDPQAGQVIAKIKIAKYFPLTDSPNIMLAKFSRYTVLVSGCTYNNYVVTGHSPSTTILTSCVYVLIPTNTDTAVHMSHVRAGFIL